jgi:hypothetical protein
MLTDIINIFWDCMDNPKKYAVLGIISVGTYIGADNLANEYVNNRINSEVEYKEIEEREEPYDENFIA